MNKFEGHTRSGGPALLAGIGGATVGAGVAYLVSFAGFPVQVSDGYQITQLPWDTVGRSLYDTLPFVGAGWTPWENWLAQNGMLDGVQLRLKIMEAAAAFGGFAFACAALPLCGYHLKFGEQQIRGRRLALPPKGKSVAAASLAPEVKRTGSNVLLAPGVPLPFEHEVKGISFCGAPGSGKTEVFKWLITLLLAQGYRIVTLDAGKGDYISGYPSDDFYLLAPHDNRIQPGADMAPQAKAWDLAADCTSVQDAAEFAARVIAESKEPQWAEGARLILQGAIVGLQATLGLKWGFRDLHEVITKTDAELNQWMLKYFPEAARYTAVDSSGSATKNAASYLTNCCAVVVKFTRPLSLAWGDTPREHRLSLRTWMLSGKGAQSIILGRSGQFSAMSAAWIGALFRLMNSVVQSPALSNEKNRRILFVLDEIRTIAAPGDNIAALSEFGRSKGVGLIVGYQSVDQLRDEKVWGEAAMDAFENVTQTKIFGKMMTTSSGRGGANAIAENVVGKGWFRRRKRQITTGKGGSSSESVGWEQYERLVVEPQFFEALAPTLRGPRAAYLATNALCVLDWPWSGWKERRPAVIPAHWIDGLRPSEKAAMGWTAEDPYNQASESPPLPWWHRLFGG